MTQPAACGVDIYAGALPVIGLRNAGAVSRKIAHPCWERSERRLTYVVFDVLSKLTLEPINRPETT